MNSFAVLADDVEDVDEVAPTTAATTTTPTRAAPTAAPVKKSPPASASASAPKRNIPLSNGGARGGRDGRRGSFSDRRGGRGGYRGGRDGSRGGRDGGRGGRGRRDGYRGGGGGFRGRGRGGGGGYHNRDRENGDDYQGRRGSNRDSDGWENSRGGVTVPVPPTADTGVVLPPTGDIEVPNGNGTHETPVTLPPTGNDETANGERGDGAGEDGEAESKGPPPPADMTLDEYMAKLKTANVVSLKKGGGTRKTNEMGGKMKALKKADDESPGDLSIMSAVSRKAAVAERTVKDSTHVAVADNAKNQEFFKNSGANSGRRTRGRDFRTHAHNHQGFRNDGSQDTRRNYGDRRRGGNGGRSNAPNMDDTNAFPALNA